MDASQIGVALVEDHMPRENAHDFPACVGVFTHPRYEIVATGEIHDGPDGVDGLLTENRDALPDFHFAASRTVAAGEAVVFEFEGTNMVCERVYFDLGTVRSLVTRRRPPLPAAGKQA